MYNQFLYKQLVLVGAVTLLLINGLTSQNSDLYLDRALDLGKSVHELSLIHISEPTRPY